MKTTHRHEDRGTTSLDWLKSHHSFSFGGFHDPARMGFGPLRVINEDWIQPGTGFGMHPHHDMEILTYIVSGELEHQDGLGHVARIGPGQVQRMSAGRGIVHSETNPSATEETQLLQIWIEPSSRGLAPSWEDLPAPSDAGEASHRLIASADGREGSARIHQGAEMWVGRLPVGGHLRHDLAPERRAWLQLITGELEASGQRLSSGDALALSQETGLDLNALGDSHYLLFDLP